MNVYFAVYRCVYWEMKYILYWRVVLITNSIEKVLLLNENLSEK